MNSGKARGKKTCSALSAEQEKRMYSAACVPRLPKNGPPLGPPGAPDRALIPLPLFGHREVLGVE